MKNFRFTLLSSLHSKKILLIAFVFLVIFFGFLLRTRGILTNNILFLFDSARDLLYVKKIVIEHDLLLIGPSSGGLQGYFHGVLWYYLLAIPFFLGGGHPAVMTFFMGVASTSSVVLTFFILRKMTSFYGAVLGTIIYSFAAYSVATAQFIWNPYPIVWLMPLYFYSLYAFVQEKFFALPLAAGLIALFIHFEAIYGICLILTLVVVVVLQLKRHETLKQKLQKIFISFFLFVLPFLPSIVFDIRHDFLISSSLYKAVTSGGENITHPTGEKPRPFGERVSLRFNDLRAFTEQSLTQNTLLNTGIFILAIIGVLQLMEKKEKKTLQFLSLCLLSLLTPFFVFLTMKYAVWGYYWIGNAPLYALSISFLLGYLYKQKKKFVPLFVLLILLFIVAYNPVKDLKSWYQSDLASGSHQALKTQLDIVNKVYADVRKENFSAYVLTPPVYDYVYRYLFWYEGKKRNLFPIDEKQKTVYLIIEPNPADPEGAFFKKNVIRTANKPEKIFRFSEITVEKIITSPGEEPFDRNFLPSL